MALCDGLEKQDTNKRARWQRYLGLYEGRAVSLEHDQYFADVPVILPPMFNLIRSGCDTAQADIAGRQKPKPMFLTTGADWKTRRRAKKLDKFVEGQLCQKQGMYSDAWQVMLTCFHDATKGGTGLAKVFGDVARKQVIIERVLPWEVHVDDREARHGNPQNIFHVYDMERDLAIEAFCNEENDPEGNEERRDALLAARTTKTITQRVSQAIKIREGWKLPLSDAKPGKHTIAVEGCTLFEEDWTRPRFPFVRVMWTPATVGYWGIGIAEEGEPQQDAVNEIAKRINDRVRICSTPRTYYNPSVIKPDQLQQGGESELLIPIKDMSQVPQTPPVQPANPAEMGWLESGIKHFYEFRGISQMTANSQKPPGVDAAVAMQTLNDIQTVRFLPKARGYETAFEDLGQLCIDAAKDIADATGGYLVRWPGKRFLQELNFKDVDLDEDMYQIRVAPVSQFSRDPAAILELAAELRQNGDITRETYLQMVGMPDFEDMLNRETAESEYIRDLLDRYLDCIDDSELEEAGGFEAPEPFISNAPGAVAICVATYWEAKRDKAPEYCLENIRKFIAMLKTVSEQQQPQQAAAAQASAGGMLAPGQQVQEMRGGASLVGAAGGMPGGAGMPPGPQGAMPTGI